MSTEAPPGSDLQELEANALEHLQAEGLAPVLDIIEEVEQARIPSARLATAVGFSVLSAAVMTGGVFRGASPRIYAAVAGILGILIASRVRRLRRPILMNFLIVLGVFGVGLLMVVPAGMDHVFGLAAAVERAVKLGDVHRPPVDFIPGWHAILAWLMAGLGFAASWVALEVRKPALGILIPLPIVAIAAISVSSAEQIGSGIASLVLFAIGLGMLSSTEMGDEQQPSLAFEMRRAARALPMIGGITALLIVMAQTDFLFPDPYYDPSQEARRPQTIPIQKIPDKILFRVKANVSGPWRMGHLDEYTSDGWWRLPPFKSSRLRPVPRSGVVDAELTPGIKAQFEINDLTGAVLPGLPNTMGIVAEGPKLAYDGRLGNIRLAQGTIERGLVYTVVAGFIPTVEELARVTQSPPEDLAKFLEVPSPPPAVTALLAKAPTTSPWERFDFVRQSFLDNVAAKGQGVPAPVLAADVQDMLAGSKEGTPYEIVAAQALLARWAGLPSRIGYGFDGGEKVGDAVEVRPKHGSTFLEVYFPTFKWLPVVGTPRQAKTEFSDDPQQFDPNVIASNEVSVKVQIPVARDAKGLLYAQIRSVIAIVVPFIAAFLFIYYSWPLLRKTIIRARRRSWASSAGARERIALAYSEWRDWCTDFGYRYDGDTPLMFLDRVVEDPEHTQFAWLVTRCLWGDLRDELTDEEATAAEEMARSLRRRLGLAHNATLRMVAAVSRLSLRYPYAPRLIAELRKEHAQPKVAFAS